MGFGSGNGREATGQTVDSNVARLENISLIGHSATIVF